MRSLSRLYNKEQASNTSTVALRVVGGDEKESVPGVTTGPRCYWGCKYGDLVLHVVGFSRDWDLRMTALARTSSNCKRQTHTLVRKDYNRRCSAGK
jgi:hypothetical protein